MLPPPQETDCFFLRVVLNFDAAIVWHQETRDTVPSSVRAPQDPLRHTRAPLQGEDAFVL